MNEQLAGVLLKGLIAALPEEKRVLYEFIVQIEDTLAQQAETSGHFLSLLVKHAPYKQAAMHFGCSYEEINRKMKEIESELDEQLHIKINRTKWLDCTNAVIKKKEAEQKRSSLYLFIV